MSADGAIQLTVDIRPAGNWADELTDFIRDEALEEYAMEIAGTGELIGLGAYRNMPESVLVYVEYIESSPSSNPAITQNRKYIGIGAALLAFGQCH